MANRNTRTNTSGYGRLKQPTPQRSVPPRAIFGLVLTVLLPPVGLLYLWHQGVFRSRGRVLLTALATVEMALLVVWLTPHAELTPRAPVPAAPPQVTAGNTIP